MKLFNILIISLIISISVASTENITSGCDLPDHTFYLSDNNEVYYNSSNPIGGFQFNVDGDEISVLSAFGGDASSSGLTIQSGGNFVLAFSITGSTIPPGCGTLIELDLSGIPNNLYEIIVSDAFGSPLIFEYYEANEDVLGCTDSEACNFNADATLDDGNCDYGSEIFGCDDVSCEDEVCLFFSNLDTTSNSLDIYMYNTDYVSGFQFEIFGITLESVTPGNIDGIDNFTVFEDSGTNIILGFSFIQGAYIEIGSYGLLAQVTFSDYDYINDNICFGTDPINNVISSYTGNSLNTNWDTCICSQLNSSDECGICGGNGVLDSCGICNGPGPIYQCGCEDFLDGACDCDGNIIDCNGICGGGTVEDECGVCGGFGLPCENEMDVEILPFNIVETLHSGDSIIQFLTIKNNSSDSVEINLEIINELITYDAQFINDHFNEHNQRTSFIYGDGDQISYDDQQISVPVCYGDNFPDEFSFQQYSGDLNNRDYYVMFVEIAASH